MGRNNFSKAMPACQSESPTAVPTSSSDEESFAPAGRTSFNPYHSHSVPKSENLQARHKEQSVSEVRITTLMLRNIPNKYTQNTLMQEINDNGFQGCYDFFYLPMDIHNRSNVGYAFINFEFPEDAKRFQDAFVEHRFQRFHSRKIGSVCVAHVQGLAANLSHFENRAVTQARNDQYRPVVLKGDRRLQFDEAMAWAHSKDHSKASPQQLPHQKKHPHARSHQQHHPQTHPQSQLQPQRPRQQQQQQQLPRRQAQEPAKVQLPSPPETGTDARLALEASICAYLQQVIVEKQVAPNEEAPATQESSGAQTQSDADADVRTLLSLRDRLDECLQEKAAPSLLPPPPGLSLDLSIPALKKGGSAFAHVSHEDAFDANDATPRTNALVLGSHLTFDALGGRSRSSTTDDPLVEDPFSSTEACKA
eukprot:TRINITY_DN4390_c2_g2_i1.p1 TRINITY_DN4390_c2_g2~~TRINITY_DN4390_c2_g2_i1.p1  ORF type:complete len:457 (-),score=97.00 TRINITY_DN4390_c2_g2_i1:102-1364(-)